MLSPKRESMRVAARYAAPFVAFTLAVILGGCGGGTDEHDVTVTVPSSSMEPTLHCAGSPGCESEVADELIVQPGSDSDVKRGDIIVFKAPPNAESVCGAGGTFIKRVVGLPGESIRENDGFFSIDGQSLDESAYIKSGRRDDRSGFWVVPKDSYFVVGDNRTKSCDSRAFGSVPRENITGTAVAIQRPSGRVDLQ